MTQQDIADALDEYGKEVVGYLIDSEYKRVRLSMKKPKPPNCIDKMYM